MPSKQVMLPCPTTLLTPTKRADMSPPADPILPDEVTEDILIRLDAAADVARAAAACRSHLRVVRDRRFLLQFRSLRPPPVLGFISSSVRVGHSSPPTAPPVLRLDRPEVRRGGPAAAAAARAVAQAGDFAFSFLPRDAASFTNWRVCDVRDGRVLLSRRRLAAGTYCFLDLAVADPLHRRYVLIPAIPDEVVLKRYSAEMGSEPFFAAARNEEMEYSQFQVIYNWMSEYKIDTFVFSSDKGKWRAATSFSLLPSRLIQDPRGSVRYHAGTCFYWVKYHGGGYMLVLDELEMSFSILGLPYPDTVCRQILPQGIAVLDAGEDGLGVIVIRYEALELELYCKKKQEEEWRLHKLIPFPERGLMIFSIVAANEGLLILEGTRKGSKSKTASRFFTLDLKTFLAERWFIPSAQGIERAYLYANYPPLLSPPSI